MEPVGSTYGGTSTVASYSGKSLRSEAVQQTSRIAANGGVAPTPEQKQQDSANNKQFGVQLSSNSDNKEFKPYGPDGKRQADALHDSSKPPPNDKPTSILTGKKQEDPQVQQQIDQLKAIEAKVKAHEAAHKAAGGSMTGSISYSYTRGPDGKSYVTGGEVPISVSPGKTPQETVTRMQQVIQAALAPADPSSQDRAVAGQAAQELQKAQQQRSEKLASSPASPSESSPSSTVSKDAGPGAENSSGSAETNATSPGERRVMPDATNSVMAQASRAYSDHSATGSSDPFRDLPTSGKFQFPAESPAPGTSPQDARKTASSLSPSMITGFGSQQSMSGYA